MTRRAKSFGRLARIRTAQQRIAQQGLAHALCDARQISVIAGRIDALSRDNDVAAGLVAGASLAAMSEMTVRLDNARRSVAGPLDRALKLVENRRRANIQAQLELDGAQRLAEKACRAAAAEAEQRGSAARCFRPVKTASDKP